MLGYVRTHWDRNLLDYDTLHTDRYGREGRVRLDNHVTSKF